MPLWTVGEGSVLRWEPQAKRLCGLRSGDGEDPSRGVGQKTVPVRLDCFSGVVMSSVPESYSPAFLKATVHQKRQEAQGVVSLELRPCNGSEFPNFEPGAHIDLHLPQGMVRSYSLCNASDEKGRYVIGVQKDRTSRGGSVYVHDQLDAGAEIEISRPRNNFPLHIDAAHSVFVAGGIGVTPIMSMLWKLKSLGRSAELIYAVRSCREAAFVDEIGALGVDVAWHFDDQMGGPPDLKSYLSAPWGANTHFYACGPGAMLDAFEDLCRAFPRTQVHLERFAARAASTPTADPAVQAYSVELRRSGLQIEVLPGKTLLEALLDAGMELNYSCQEGVCGACKTRVLSGEPEHRDFVLSEAERASANVMTPCVSGCRRGPLVLDL